jgi:hypothetical protein
MNFLAKAAVAKALLSLDSTHAFKTSEKRFRFKMKYVQLFLFCRTLEVQKQIWAINGCIYLKFN